MNFPKNKNAIFFRLNDRDYRQLNETAAIHGFRSGPDLARTVVRFALNWLENQSRKKREITIGEEIEEMFDNYITSTDDFVFTTQSKPKNTI